MQYKTVLEIVNIVLKRLHLNTVSDLDDSAFSELLLDTLNNVTADIAEAGNYANQRNSKEFTLTNGVVLVSASSYAIHRIEEVYYGTRPLVVKQPYELKRRQKQSSTQTFPVEYALTDVSAGAVEITVWGIPSTTTVVDVAYYTSPKQYGTTDANTTVYYNYLTVAQGMYADMLLKEAGEASSDYQIEYAKYKDRRDKEVAKYTYNTGTELQFRYTWD